MNRLRMCGLLVVGSVLLPGCAPKMTIEQMKEMMPSRPAELDRLNMFAGKWEWTGEATMAGLDQTLKSTGSSEAKWEGDGWYLVSRVNMHMDEFGDMQGIETWTYDSHSKKYRSTWVDSMGYIGSGESTYDANSKTWRMKAMSYGPMGKSKMTGHLTFMGDDKMEYEWAEYSGFMKTMEMKGTGRRVE